MSLDAGFEHPVAESDARLVDRCLARLLAPPPMIGVCRDRDAERLDLERYIAAKFASEYAAQLREFMPSLLYLRWNGAWSAAAGMRFAAGGPLFLERYLGNDVESRLREVTGKESPRQRIVEIGNLVATRSGASQMLFLVLTGLLHRAGMEWMVFTATPLVQTSLARLGFTFLCLGDALPEHLGDAAACWGTYYQYRPQVIAGRVDHAVNCAQRQPAMKSTLARYAANVEALAGLLEPQSRCGALPNAAVA
jgi:hypothetical protein